MNRRQFMLGSIGVVSLSAIVKTAGAAEGAKAATLRVHWGRLANQPLVRYCLGWIRKADGVIVAHAVAVNEIEFAKAKAAAGLRGVRDLRRKAVLRISERINSGQAKQFIHADQAVEFYDEVRW